MPAVSAGRNATRVNVAAGSWPAQAVAVAGTWTNQVGSLVAGPMVPVAQPAVVHGICGRGGALGVPAGTGAAAPGGAATTQHSTPAAGGNTPPAPGRQRRAVT